MSKSLGNVFTVKDILRRVHPDVVRLFMLRSHYKSIIDFSEDGLRDARSAMERFYTTLETVNKLLAGCGDFDNFSGKDLSGEDEAFFKKVESLPERFVDAMDDDFNTARAIGYVFETLRRLNTYISDNADRSEERAFLFTLDAAKRRMRETGKVLGLFLADPSEYFRLDKDRELRRKNLTEEEIETLVEERNRARRERDWERADEIRNRLRERGVLVRDSSEGSSWTVQ
jgi:cysteinyl-tRNA synthetase